MEVRYFRDVKPSRREVIELCLAATSVPAAGGPAFSKDGPEDVSFTLKVNGVAQRISADPRVTLLDLLRERLQLTGTKKGCDHGQCGACTVLRDGERVLSCLTLAVSADGSEISTIEGLSADGSHPVQQAFIRHDGFQCGYCTPGQIMSVVALIREGIPSSDEGIRESMSGNLCRCGAYNGIVDAIRDIRDAGGQK